MLLTTIETHLPVQPALAPAVYTAEVITSLDQFASMEEEWITLVQRSGLNSINVDFGFLFHWANHFCPQSLFIITVRNQFGTLVGVAPFKIARPKSGAFKRLIRHLQFIGTEPDAYDGMEIILAQDENTDLVLDKILAAVKENRHRWDVLDLRFCPNHTQLQRLEETLLEVSFTGRLEATMSHPYMELPESVELYQALKPKNRKKFKRHFNQLCTTFGDAKGELYFFETGEEMFYHLNRLAERHIEFWGERGVTSVFKKYPTMKQFYQDLLTYYSTVPIDSDHLHIGRVSFSALKIANQFVSYDIGFHMSNNQGYLGHMSTYDKAFSKFAPGFLQTELMVHFAIEQTNTQRYYFGRGDEPHKEQWVNDREFLWNLTIYRQALWGSLLQLDEVLKQLAADGKQLLKSLEQKRHQWLHGTPNTTPATL